jgi:NAD(P)H-hydrate epimerase
MSGAATLAGLGALRGGAGLVYLAVPEAILTIVASSEPSYLTIPLPHDPQGRLTRQAGALVQARLEEMTAAAIGPGLGQSPELTELVRGLYVSTTCPLVIDADGLNALAGGPIEKFRPAGPRILTPHPGEFSRLTGQSPETVSNSRALSAVTLARATGACVVLKGPGTVVTDGTQVYINTTGNSGMATGGSGDVLTGLMTALLAQGMAPFAAAQLGVYLHGLAGDLASQELSQPGLIASDLPRYLGKAFLQYSSGTVTT